MGRCGWLIAVVGGLWLAAYGGFSGIASAEPEAKARPQPAPEIVPQVGHTDSVDALALSRDGSVLISGSIGDRTVRVWDAGTGDVTPFPNIPSEAVVMIRNIKSDTHLLGFISSNLAMDNAKKQLLPASRLRANNGRRVGHLLPPCAEIR